MSRENFMKNEIITSEQEAFALPFSLDAACLDAGGVEHRAKES
jgi:hypothetical protein